MRIEITGSYGPIQAGNIIIPQQYVLLAFDLEHGQANCQTARLEEAQKIEAI